MLGDWAVEILVIILMIAINGVFAGYELALASISHSRIQHLAGQKRAGAKAAQYMKQNMEGSLAAVQLGITLVGAVAAATGGAGAEERLAPYLRNALGLPAAVAEPIAIACVVLPLTAVTIVFGELIPKVFALRNKEWMCLRLSPGIWFFSAITWPAVGALEWSVSKLMALGERIWKPRPDESGQGERVELQELRASVALARTSRLIGPREERIMLGAASLSQRPVREIMLPARFISMLDVNASVAESLIAAHHDMHTRFPVTTRPGDPQAIIGYVNFKDLVALLRLSPENPQLAAIVRNIISFRDHEPVASCLETLIRSHAHIALVRDGQNKVIGIVSLEDMIEELVGEIEDEYDRLPAHLSASGAGWVAGGGVTLERLRDEAGIDVTGDLPNSEARTLNDWVLGHLDRPVTGGEILERPPMYLIVRKVRRQKVLEALVKIRRTTDQ